MAGASEDNDDWEIEARVRLEEADYLHAWFYVPEFHTIWHYLVFLPFGFALVVVGAPAPWRHGLSYWPWMVVSVPLGVLAAWAYRKYWAAAVFTRVGPRQIVYRFDPEGLQVSSSFGEQSYAWDALWCSIETPRAFLVFSQRTQFFLVPKRSFSAPELAEVTDLLATMPERSGGGRLLRAVGVWVLLCALFLALFAFLPR